MHRNEDSSLFGVDPIVCTILNKYSCILKYNYIDCCHCYCYSVGGKVMSLNKTPLQGAMVQVHTIILDMHTVGLYHTHTATHAFLTCMYM